MMESKGVDKLMHASNLMTDPEAIRSNQQGQLTKDQTQSLRSKLGELPGWLILILFLGLLIASTLIAGKTLQSSTPLAIAAVLGMILVTFAITSFLGESIASLRMVNLKVEPAPGRVIWNNNRYTAVVAGLTLEPITNGFNLKPGEYTFYVLSGTKYLLSAQPASGSTSFSGGAQVSTSASPAVDMENFKALLSQPLVFDPHLEPAMAAQRLMQLRQAAQALEASNLGSLNRAEAAGLMRQMAEQTRSLMQNLSLQDMVAIGRQVELDSQPNLDD